MSYVGLWSVIVAFPGHTRLFFQGLTKMNEEHQ